MKDKKIYIKTAGIGLLAILTYFILPRLEKIPLTIFGINTETMPLNAKIIYMIAYETVMLSLIIIIFYPKLKKDFNDMKINHMNYYSKYFKYWIFSLIVMMVSNQLITPFSPNGIASNEQAIQDLFGISPAYIFFSAVIFAPVVEELIFRQGIRYIVPNNILFIILSGLIFGGLHVINSEMKSISELLYLIPYCAPGLVFAYILTKTNNIFVSMGLHFMHNGLLIALNFFLLFFS